MAPGWLGGGLEVAEGREGVLVIAPALAHLDACLEEDLRPVRRQGWLIEARERWATESSGRDFEARFGRGGGTFLPKKASIRLLALVPTALSALPPFPITMPF